MMITSNEFFLFHSCSDLPLFISLLESNPKLPSLLKRMSYFDPNYGPLWFRCRDFLLAGAKEVGVLTASDG